MFIFVEKAEKQSFCFINTNECKNNLFFLPQDLSGFRCPVVRVCWVAPGNEQLRGRRRLFVYEIKLIISFISFILQNGPVNNIVPLSWKRPGGLETFQPPLGGYSRLMFLFVSANIGG